MMQMAYSEFTRVIRAVERMAGAPAYLTPAFPGLVNVLFGRPLAREGMWAFFCNGHETLGLRVALAQPFSGRLLFPRAVLIEALAAMADVSAQADDMVALKEGVVSLRRSSPARTRKDIDIAAPTNGLCNITTLPDPAGNGYLLPSAALQVIQRATKSWDGSGGCLWLREQKGVFTYARGATRHGPCDLRLPSEQLCFPCFSGILGMDPSLPVECFLTTNPNKHGGASRCVGFRQPGAMYFSVQHTEGDVAAMDLPRRESALSLIMAEPKPWLLVSRRTDRRALIRALTDLEGGDIRLSSDGQGVVRASNGVSSPITLPMVKAEGQGAVICREIDLRRVLRQGFGRLDMPGRDDMAAIIFERSPDAGCGAITAAVRG